MDPAGPGQARRSPGDHIVIALFALLLLAPALLALTGHAGFDTAFIERNELRHPFAAPPPTTGALATGGWQRDAEREIADAFPLRTRLVEAYYRATYLLLHDVTSTSVIAGRDGWLFLGLEERWYVTGEHRPSDGDLARLADVYAGRSRWCAQHGIAYAFVLAPNKSTIYADDLPPGMQIVRPTPADRLMPLLRARGVRTVDLRDELRALAREHEAREETLLYSRGDTHWNDAGAYAAYQATTAALKDAGVRDTIAGDSIKRRIAIEDGGLYRLAGIASLVQDRVVRLDFRRKAHTVSPPTYANDPDAASFVPIAFANEDRSLPDAVVFGDSFTDAFVPFLAESFRRTVLLRHVDVSSMRFDTRALETEKPRVVIEERVERSLVQPPDVNR